MYDCLVYFALRLIVFDLFAVHCFALPFTLFFCFSLQCSLHCIALLCSALLCIALHCFALVPQLGLPKGVLTVSQSNGWAVLGDARPGFLEGAGFPGSLGLQSLVPEPPKLRSFKH